MCALVLGAAADVGGARGQQGGGAERQVRPPAGADDHEAAGDRVPGVGAAGERTAPGGYEVLLAVRGLPDEGGFGTAFGALGDIDGDGVSDFFVTAPYRAAGRQRRGSVRAFSGADGRTLWRADGEAFLERGPYQEGELGFLAAACGDADGDGVGDLVVASVDRDAEGRRELALHVLSGADGARLHVVKTGQPADGACLVGAGGRVWVAAPAADLEGGSPGEVLLVSAAGEVLAVHRSSEHAPGADSGAVFGAVCGPSAGGALWVAETGSPPRFLRLQGETVVPHWPYPVQPEGARRGLGEHLLASTALRCPGGEEVPGAVEGLLAAARSDGGYRVEHYAVHPPHDPAVPSAMGLARRTAWGLEVDAVSPPLLAEVPAFAGAGRSGTFALSWTDASRRGRVEVRELGGGAFARIETHACGHAFSDIPRGAPLDLDGDGTSELLVGGPGHFHGHPLSAQGEVQLVRYAADAAAPPPDADAFDAAVLRERGVLRVLTPPRAVAGLPSRAGFGGSVRAGGDVDGDGVGDLLVGTWIAGEDSQQVLVCSGRTGERLFALVDAKLFDVAPLGDRDGDGRGDLVALTTDVPQRPGGAAWLASGAFGGPLATVGTGREAFAGWGQRVAVVGDVDGDGIGELLVGAPTDSDGDGTVGPASARLHSGADGAELFRWDRGDRRDELGSALAGTGDLDGDGVPDVLVGAPSAAFEGDDRDRRGCVLAFSGAGGATIFEAWGDGRGDRFGHALAAAPDVDGDGVPDVLVGAPTASSGGADRGGRAYVLSGATGARLLELAARRPDERFGQAVACADDLDGDGAPELLVGAPVAAHVFPPRSGRVYAFAPTGEEAFRVNDPPRPDDAVRGDFGWSLALPGDVDGDGRPDLAVGAPYRRLGRDDGSVWIFSGAAFGDR